MYLNSKVKMFFTIAIVFIALFGVQDFNNNLAAKALELEDLREGLYKGTYRNYTETKKGAELFIYKDGDDYKAIRADKYGAQIVNHDIIKYNSWLYGGQIWFNSTRRGPRHLRLQEIINDGYKIRGSTRSQVDALGLFDGGFEYIYQDLAFEPSDLVIKGEKTNWTIKPWDVIKNDPQGKFKELTFSAITLDDDVNGEQPSENIKLSVSTDRDLQIEVIDHVPGDYNVTVNAIIEPLDTFITHDSIKTEKYEIERNFTITIKEDDETLSNDDFNTELTDITNENDVKDMLNRYSEELLRLAPCENTLVKSFENIVEEVDRKGVDLKQNLDKAFLIKRIGADANDIKSTLNIPSYSFEGQTKAKISQNNTLDIKSKVNDILDNNAKLNDVLEKHGLSHYRSESVLNIKAEKVANDDIAILEVPIKIIKEAFEQGIDNVSLYTHNARIIFKPDTFYLDDPYYHDDPFVFDNMFNPENAPEKIAFKAEKINNSHFETFNLKVFLDEQDFSEFYNETNKNFFRDLSVHLPYEYDEKNKDDLHMLRVEHFDEDTGDTKIKGGSYDEKNKKMKFDTKHFSVFFITSSSRTFDDLNAKNHWSKRFVDSLAAKGIVKEVVDNNADFKPDNFITRAEASIMVANAFRLLELGVPNPFSDIDDNAIYAPHVLSLHKHGVVRGTGDGKFSPDAEITRQDAAVILTNVLMQRHEGYLSTPSNFESYLKKYDDEGDISNYARRSVAFLTANGILNGQEKGDQINLNPGGHLSRAQMSVLIYKCLEIKDIQAFPYHVRKIVDVN